MATDPSNDRPKNKLRHVHHALISTCTSSVTRYVTFAYDELKLKWLGYDKRVHTPHGFSHSQAVIELMLKEEGMIGIWEGILPVTIITSVYAVSKFTSFEVISKILREDVNHSPRNHFICGTLSGMCSIGMTYPLFIIRRNLGEYGHHREAESFHRAIKKIYCRHGMKGFFRGIWAPVILAAPYGGIFFASYVKLTSIWRRVAQEKPVVSGSSITAVSSYGTMMCAFISAVISKVSVQPIYVLYQRAEKLGYEKSAQRIRTGVRHSGVVYYVKNNLTMDLFKGIHPGLFRSGSIAAANIYLYVSVCTFVSKRLSTDSTQENTQTQVEKSEIKEERTGKSKK